MDDKETDTIRLKKLEVASLMALGYLKALNSDSELVPILADALKHTDCDYVKAILKEK